MAKKQILKLSEARILTYLAKVEPRLRFVQATSNKLDMDYPYCLSIIGRMHIKNWLKKEEGRVKHYYHVTSISTNKLAEEMVSQLYSRNEKR